MKAKMLSRSAILATETSLLVDIVEEQARDQNYQNLIDGL